MLLCYKSVGIVDKKVGTEPKMEMTTFNSLTSRFGMVKM